ncbi:MAG: hypothetical protein DRH04_02040 [Deltaproteobacteria bacterium]|nr:MAG: hypothetical protein DRH04_02040 [Deltaproteobacteria bacterium]
MDVIIIAKNTSDQDIEIPDLGISIPARDQRNLTNEFSLDELDQSSDLKALIEAEQIVINDGTQDLNKDDALDQVSLETVYVDEQESVEIWHKDLLGLDANDHPQYALISQLQDPNGNHDLVDWSQVKNAPQFGSEHWLNPVETKDDLPTDATTGDCVLVHDDGDGKAAQYWFDGSQWVKISDVDWAPVTNLNQIPNRSHSDLQGLVNDDHPQYLNQSRADARYYTKEQVDQLVDLDYDDISANDPNTDVTGSELEDLTSGGDISRNLHTHGNYADKEYNESITGKWSFSNGRLVIPVRTSFPPSPSVGEQVFRTDLKKTYTWNGTDWVAEEGVTDHGQLTGLDDDDHPQYLLIDGSRAMTGNLNMSNHHIRNIDYLDLRDRSSNPSVSDGAIWFRSDEKNLYVRSGSLNSPLQLCQVIQVYDQNGGQNINVWSPVRISWDFVYFGDSIFDLNNGRIVVKLAGLYEVFFCVSANNENSARKNIRAFLLRDGVEEIASCYAYARNRTDSALSLTASALVELEDESYLEVFCQRIGSSGACRTISWESWMFVKLLRRL